MDGAVKVGLALYGIVRLRKQATASKSSTVLVSEEVRFMLTWQNLKEGLSGRRIWSEG